jgi:hypothetical protein
MLSGKASAVKMKSGLAQEEVSNWEPRWKARRREQLGVYRRSAAAMSAKGPALSQKTRKGRAPAFVCGEGLGQPTKSGSKPLANSMRSGVR